MHQSIQSLDTNSALLDTSSALRDTCGMIARSWSAQATRGGALGYVEFFAHTLASQLRQIPGYRESIVLQRVMGEDLIEITVLTFWESMDAVARFAGATPETSVVEPEAQAHLLSFDRHVKHYEVASRT